MVVFVLRLHTDDIGHVWYGHDGAGIDSGCQVDEFLDSADLMGCALSQVDSVRLLGSAVNAALIVGLYRVQSGLTDKPRIQLCAPLLCGGTAAAHPLVVLRALFRLGVDSTLVCCDLNEHNYTSYVLLASLHESGGNGNEKCQRILRHHPAWPALSFPITHDPCFACKLVSHIVDPRWFRDPARPNRISRLTNYLGITPANAAFCCSADGNTGGRHVERFLDTFYAWCGRGGIELNCGDDPHSSPRNFLKRVGLAAGNAQRGVLAATVCFVRFVVEVWLARVCGRWPEVGFMAEHFFKNAIELEHYTRHCAALESRGL